LCLQQCSHPLLHSHHRVLSLLPISVRVGARANTWREKREDENGWELNGIGEEEKKSSNPPSPATAASTALDAAASTMPVKKCFNLRQREIGVGVEVVLRRFHRCRHWSSTAVVLLLEGLRSHKVLVIRGYDGHEGLHGLGRRSVTPYVHG
jgi:hypothetical protein